MDVITYLEHLWSAAYQETNSNAEKWKPDQNIRWLQYFEVVELEN